MRRASWFGLMFALGAQACFPGSSTSHYSEPTDPVLGPVSPAVTSGAQTEEDVAIPGEMRVSFVDDVIPIFERHGCVDCHGGEGGLDVLPLGALLRTGDHAPVVIPCDPDNSILLQKLSDAPPFGDRMPLGRDPLSVDEIATIRLWIAGGGDPEACQEPLDAGPSDAADVALEDTAQEDTAPPDVPGDTDPQDTSDDTAMRDVPMDVPPDTVEPEDTAPEDTGAIEDIAPDIEDEPREPRTEELDYALDVRPMLERYDCVSCHGGVAGLFLGTAAQALEGGLRGPSTVSCDPDGSLLVQKVESNPPFGRRMPTRGGFMTDADIALLRQWIAEGAEQTYNPETCP